LAEGSSHFLAGPPFWALFFAAKGGEEKNPVLFSRQFTAGSWQLLGQSNMFNSLSPQVAKGLTSLPAHLFGPFSSPQKAVKKRIPSCSVGSLQQAAGSC
jgi:hypothetical protein